MKNTMSYGGSLYERYRHKKQNTLFCLAFPQKTFTGAHKCNSQSVVIQA